MSNDYGSGVSRVLDPTASQFLNLIFQKGKPPLDAEFTLLADLADNWQRVLTLQNVPSGWIADCVNPDNSFLTDSSWSNWFRYGQQNSGEKQAVLWAAINGWLIPVTGTGTGSPPGSPNDTDTWNKITLDPPPSNSGDSRIDFIFLEAWLAKVAPNPSTTNKPSASGIYRYGNVEGGYTYLTDAIQDPAIGFETTQRTQLQYRLRVVSGLVGLTSYPDGFDPTVVKARGAASSNTSYTFENMRQELGDPGLWRAGDGTSNALNTIDGYSYAVPLCAIFRRNSVAWDGDPGQNLNGSFNRNPTATDRTGATTFSTTPTLASDITASDLSLSLSSATSVPLPLTPSAAVTIQIGDEIMTYSSITGTTMTLVSRGALGSKAETHKAGDTITVLAGRPDGLFADQIAKTDILDLRHVVHPNGFDYDTMLKANLDKLMRGELRANWKRSGGGPQGPFVFYQDKISASSAALGVTLLDSPDGHRTVFSDAAMQQSMEAIIDTSTGSSAGWSLGLTVNTNQATSSEFNPGDTITIPVAQLKTSLPGSDTDQLQFISDTGAVSIRIDGYAKPLVEGVHYAVTPITGPSDDLVITLDGANFPTDITKNLYVTFHVQWGPGRGISRRPDIVHSVSYLSAGSSVMTQQAGVPSDNTPTRTSWAPLWSKYRSSMYNSLLPVTAESYVDPGSKTIILTPYRRIEVPDPTVLDGETANANYDDEISSGTTGSSNGTTTFSDAGGSFSTDSVVTGNLLVIASGTAKGEYRVTTDAVGDTSIEVSPEVPTDSNITYTIVSSQGLMPSNDISGAAKWTTPDPLNLFSGHTDSGGTQDLYITLPRKLVPGWGEVRIPIVHTDGSVFDEGINFMIHTTKGDKTTAYTERNYIPSYASSGSLSYAYFSTADLDTYSSGPVTATSYNTAYTFGGNAYAGMRFFTDNRSLGREGLELPPFYGIARLFAIYEAEDYETNGSSYNSTTREYDGGGAVNLLRQNFDGATFWIEIDDDGDSTFVINADVIDIAKSPNTISSFSAGHYVIEANIFGFDRNTFDLDHEARIVLARDRDGSNQANSGTRTDNYGPSGSIAEVFAPPLVIPAPTEASDEIAVNYSRTPYQGDAWGSQTSQQDIGHKQGPLLTSTAYQIASTELDESSLTRPNQKGLEVLSSTGFMTTLGSGRLSGDRASGTIDFRNVGYEDLTNWPPPTSIADRPVISTTALVSGESGDLSTEYHGCTERLPLGSLFRDKDFRGGFVAGNLASQVQSPLIYTDSRAPGILASSIASDQSFEQVDLPISMSSLSSGQPGELVVHVDGEQGNYGLLVNYRTNRGGSAFAATPPRPGGELASLFTPAGTSSSWSNVLVGVAYLVRNTVTSIQSTEVSAGSELLLLVATTVVTLGASSKDLKVFVGTNGTGEGYSSVDIYRLQGHPLVRDNTRFGITPSSITLSKKVPSI